MRWLLFFVALSASADCTSRTLLRADKEVLTAHIDGGALYFSFAGEAVIRRLDEVTGEGTPFFTADGALAQWDIEDGAIALLVSGRLMVVPRGGAPRVIAEPADARRLQLHGGYLYWKEDSELQRVAAGGGPIETIAPVLAYAVFGDGIVFNNASGLYRQTFGGAPVLVHPAVGTLIAATGSAILTSAYTNFDPHTPQIAILRVPWTGGPVAILYKINGPFDGGVSATAYAADATIFVVIETLGRVFGPEDTLWMLRNGAHFLDAAKSLRVFAADDDQVTFGRFLDGAYQVDRRCVSVPRARAAR